MMKYYKNAQKFFSKHPDQNAFVHLLLGVGIGFMLTYPVAGAHPIRWGALFVLMGGIGHLWASTQKGK